jgi:hypothetical protein
MIGDVYGPVCANGWTHDWSAATCLQMNFVGVEDSFNTTLDSNDFFSLNSSLITDAVDLVQEAKSNYEEPCSESINLQCVDFSKYTCHWCLTRRRLLVN